MFGVGKARTQNQFVYPWIEKVILIFALLLIVSFLLLSTSNVSFRHYFFKTADKELSSIPFGKITAIEGKITRQKQYDTEFVSLAANDAVFPNDTIMTSKESSAIVELDNGERIEIGPNSLVKLDFEFDFSFSELIPKQIIQVVPKAAIAPKKEVKVIAKAGAPVKVFRPTVKEGDVAGKPRMEPIVIVTPTPQVAVEAPTPVETVAPLTVEWTTPQKVERVLLTPTDLKAGVKSVPLSLNTNHSTQLQLKIAKQGSNTEPEWRNIVVNDKTALEMLEFRSPGEYTLELYDDEDKILDRRKVVLPKYSKVLEPLPATGNTTKLRSEEPAKEFEGVTLRWKPFVQKADYRVSILQNGTRKVKQRLKTNKSEITVSKGRVPLAAIEYIVEQELPSGFVVVSEIQKVDFEYVAPILTNPANSAAISNAGPKSKVFFTWTKTNFTSGYEIQISRRTDFTETYVKKRIKDNVLLLVNIPPGEYYWRVRSFSAQRYSPYSEVFRLSIQ